MDDPFKLLTAAGVDRCILLSDPPSGLMACIVLDDMTLGPAAGGIRTLPYRTFPDALADAARLAAAMTVKCALAGLPAGGGKGVVIDHPDLRRERAFERLGARVEELGGIFRTAGDMGTSSADLAAMARATRHVYTGEAALLQAAGRGMLRCVEACVEVLGAPGVDDLHVAVQGCGAIGGAVARALAAAGARLTVADVDSARAERLAREVRASTCDPREVLLLPVDIVAPCAAGGVITASVARALRSRAVCGAANNILADAVAGRILHERGIPFVPDVVASAGAVIEGIGDMVMALQDRSTLVDALGVTAREILTESRRRDLPPSAVALERARARVAAGTHRGRADPPTSEVG